MKFIVQACAGEQLKGSPDSSVARVCTDSRGVQAGDLFVALAGENFDGHKFLADAAGKGAAGVMVKRRKRVPELPAACAVIVVDDTRKALGRLAAEYRKDFSLPIIAVAGSNGKTTTKELIASVLRQKLKTLWSEASFNNDIGVPITLLRLDPSHQAAVLEAGTNHPGELAPLVQLIQPRYGVITNIGREHLEFFGDLAGVAQEEGSLAELLPPDGTLFINGDTEWAQPITQRTRATVVRVGTGPDNDWQATNIRPARGGVSFRARAPRKEFNGEFKISLLGRHQVINALLAMAVGGELGLGRAEVQRGLAECRPPRMRLELWERNGVRVLDDAYNANADSVIAALQTLQDLPCKGRRVAVLGDMAELGAHSQGAHEEIGRRAAESGIGQLFAVGKRAAEIGRGARDAGLNRVFEFNDVATAAAAVKSFVKRGDVVLLKASRATRLERIAELLRTEDAKN